MSKSPTRVARDAPLGEGVVGTLFAINCGQPQASSRRVIALRLSLGAAFALLWSEDRAPVMIGQPKSDGSRRPGVRVSTSSFKL
jgi:hypothetical protein